MTLLLVYEPWVFAGGSHSPSMLHLAVYRNARHICVRIVKVVVKQKPAVDVPALLRAVALRGRDLHQSASEVPIWGVWVLSMVCTKVSAHCPTTATGANLHHFRRRPERLNCFRPSPFSARSVLLFVSTLVLRRSLYPPACCSRGMRSRNIDELFEIRDFYHLW